MNLNLIVSAVILNNNIALTKLIVKICKQTKKKCTQPKYTKLETNSEVSKSYLEETTKANGKIIT